MDLMQLLQEQLSGNVLTQVSEQIGASEEQTAQAAGGIFASLVGGLANNAASPSGLSALSAALDRDHDGSVLDDIMGLVGGMAQGASPATNGLGILNHILGGKQEQVAQQVSQSSGLNMGQIMKLMPILAPIVMGLIGKLRNSNTTQGQGAGGGLFDLASILMGSAQSAQGGGFGDLIGTVLGGVLGGSQSAPQEQQTAQSQAPQAGGLFGKLLGSIFKGR
ncbi:MAG: DUF937 domain-containing protein [Saprospiraceae bacterium]|nr:DUF937 domain-containing protein [Saprospiraceae bacterium]MBK7738638.1 DUF937 domain-containing protein [Saprospiraceae bacterium]MBK7912790.1 DUF937 domain-containing protein [Saprospiraceae bacterium]